MIEGDRLEQVISFIHLLGKYILNAYHVPVTDIILGTRDTKNENFSCYRAYILVRTLAVRVFSPSVHFQILKISQRSGRVLCG